MRSMAAMSTCSRMAMDSAMNVAAKPVSATDGSDGLFESFLKPGETGHKRTRTPVISIG